MNNQNLKLVIPRKMRTWSASRLSVPLVCAALLWLPGCVGVDVSSDLIELQVAGPPIEASETRQSFLYKNPSLEPNQDRGLLAQRWSMLGREDKSAALGIPEYTVRQCLADPDYFQGLDNVIDGIARQAASHRIVIINESHVITRHRRTTSLLLPRLRSLGFTVFAAETFANTADGETPFEMHSDVEWVHQNDGFYSREPAFGRLVRRAKALGYRMAAYEQVDDPNDSDDFYGKDSIARREAGQARNLANLLSTMRPDERLLIHVGYSHAKEVPVIGRSGKETVWMTARLKALTGIEPLTVAQTECRSEGESAFLARSPTDASTDWYDTLISHPLDKFERQRPDWRRDAGDTEVDIPSSLRPVDKPLIIEAFVQGEPFDSVPTDRVFVEPGEDIPLLLPPGKYTLRAVKPEKE